jgi:hypothetical protein
VVFSVWVVCCHGLLASPVHWQIHVMHMVRGMTHNQGRRTLLLYCLPYPGCITVRRREGSVLVLLWMVNRMIQRPIQLVHHGTGRW